MSAFSTKCELCGKAPAVADDILCNICLRLHPESLVGGVMQGGGPDPVRTVNGTKAMRRIIRDAKNPAKLRKAS